VLSLKLLRVSVPQYKVRGDTALLECQYELGGDKLYSVKWYKDNEEFYRYMPRSDTIQLSYKVEGVRVEVSCIISTQDNRSLELTIALPVRKFSFM
jgi:hypothetical protein